MGKDLLFNPKTEVRGTRPLAARAKSWLIDKATGSLMPRLIMAATAAAAAAIMKTWGVLVDKIPGIDAVIDPRIIVDLASMGIVAMALLGIARWTGKPVRVLQEQLRAAGCYYGRTDGHAAEMTGEGLARAINRTRVEVRQGRIVNTLED